MSIPNRELQIQYGSFVVGGSSGVQFDGDMSTKTNYEEKKSFAEFDLTFAFIVTSTTESGFATACTDAETAFRKPFQDLKVMFGGSTHLDVKHSNGTGLEIKSEITKKSSELNTGRMRVYSVRITGGLPADDVSTVGLREFATTVSAAPSGRRTINLSGVFTANGSTKARATYLAAIDALAATAFTNAGGGGTFELVGRSREESSYNDLTLAFSRDYQEIIFGQVGSGDDQQIVQQQLVITKHRRSERNATSAAGRALLGKGSTSDGGGTGGGQPFVEIEASFSASVDASKTKDLKAVWARVKTWAVSQMQAVFGSGTMALIDERPSYQWDDNRITATLMGIGVDAGSSGVIRMEQEATTSTQAGKTLVPVWGMGPYGYFVYDGPAVRTATVRTTVDQAAGGGASAGGTTSAVGLSLGVGRGGSGGGAFTGAVGSGLGNIFGNEIDNTVSGQPGSGADQVGGGATPGASPPGTSGTSPGPAGSGGSNGASANPTGYPSGGTTAIPISQESTTSQDVLGLDGKQINITRIVTVQVVQFVDLATAGSSGGGSV